MTLEEKRAWIRLVTAVGAYGWYLAVVLSRAGGRDGGRGLAGVPYAAALLWSIGAAILAAIVLEIVISIANPKMSRVKDIRDKQIGRMGDLAGQSFVLIGATSALLMALAGWQRFWIANVIYLGFVLSAVLSNVAKVCAYRGRFPEW